MTAIKDSMFMSFSVFPLESIDNCMKLRNTQKTFHIVSFKDTHNSEKGTAKPLCYALSVKGDASYAMLVPL